MKNSKSITDLILTNKPLNQKKTMLLRQGEATTTK